jgi:hypothetical protein
MATLQERYDAAVEAYHRLTIGESPRVVVDQNGERIEYTATNSSRLSQYIADLARQLEIGTPTKPMSVWFK